jgi:hypothetical protein
MSIATLPTTIGSIVKFTENLSDGEAFTFVTTLLVGHVDEEGQHGAVWGDVYTEDGSENFTAERILAGNAEVIYEAPAAGSDLSTAAVSARPGQVVTYDDGDWGIRLTATYTPGILDLDGQLDQTSWTNSYGGGVSQAIIAASNPVVLVPGMSI